MRTTGIDGREPIAQANWDRVRHAAAIPCGVGAAAMYTLWQLAVEQKGFAHTLLVERVSGSSVPPLPLGYANVLQLKLIMLWRQLSSDPGALGARRSRVQRSIRDRLEAAGVGHGAIGGIAEYQADDLDPRRFYREHARKGVPCVIRGFAGGDLSRYRFAALAERFPDAVAQAVDTVDEQITTVRLQELSEDAGARYEPLQALLEQDERLRECFDLDRVRPYFPIFGRPSSPIVSFLILGMGKGLAAEFHCEESPNWYLAVSGSKRWTLVDAEYSWLMYPAALGDGMRRFSEFKPADDGTPQDKEHFDLFDFAPRAEVELHPGDVLFFPAWMWHK